MSYYAFLQRFPNEESCLRELLKRKNPSCPCGKPFYKHPTRSAFVCGCGKTTVNPKAGTVFHRSSTPLHKWFFAMYLVAQSRNGVSSHEMRRLLGVTLKTAHRINLRIKGLMVEEFGPCTGEVEADETMVGGRHWGKRGRGAFKKTVVFGMLEREPKRVRAFIVPNCKATSLEPLIRQHLDPKAVFITDELKTYIGVAYRMGVRHRRVNHSAHLYAEGPFHTNSIENFWGQLKRSLDGTHHSVSPRYLPLYVAEYAFRYNHSSSDLFQLLLDQVMRPADG